MAKTVAVLGLLAIAAFVAVFRYEYDMKKEKRIDRITGAVQMYCGSIDAWTRDYDECMQREKEFFAKQRK